MRKILIYCYGNNQMGMGHVYKMSALAATLDSRLQGRVHICFLVPDYPEGVAYVRKRGHQVIGLDHHLDEAGQLEAAEIILRDFQADLIIVDALKSSVARSQLFKNTARYLAVFDDTGPGHRYADLVLNILYQCPYPEDAVYTLKNSQKYIFLRPEFQEYNRQEKIIPGRAANILISQGGADTYGVIPELIKLLDPIPADIAIHPVIGPSFEHWPELEAALSASSRRFNILQNVDDMASLMNYCDLAITSAGITLYELAAVGVPSLVVTQEYKELETAARFDSYGFIVNHGLWEELDRGKLLHDLIDLIHSAPRRKKMSESARMAVDGRGINRVTDLLMDYLL